MRDPASSKRPPVRLEAWSAGDAGLLTQLNEPEMTRYVGGPETPRELADRQSRYEAPHSRQYRIAVGTARVAVGWVGYWETQWRERPIWEIGWAVIQAFQGRGIATTATALAIDKARGERRHASVHAFPMTTNARSNTLCRKLGFTLIDEIDFPARRGGFVRCNDWRLDLFDEDEPAGEASGAGAS
jgi:RimJ/RimL family protein N-acetyltransferase